MDCNGLATTSCLKLTNVKIDIVYLVTRSFAQWLTQAQYNYFTVSTGIGRINHFWSLAIEEHYYIFLPFFLLLITNKAGRVLGLLGISATCEILRIIARKSGSNFGEILFLTHFRMDALAIGSVLGLLDVPRSEGLRLSAFLSIIFLWIAPSILSRDQVPAPII